MEIGVSIVHYRIVITFYRTIHDIPSSINGGASVGQK